MTLVVGAGLQRLADGFVQHNEEPPNNRIGGVSEVGINVQRNSTRRLTEDDLPGREIDLE
ncbi:MAG: hypothetical protein WBM50_27355 [Acidimicrobiales bacterium]